MSVMRMDVHYYDEERSSDLIVCGQWEYQQAQRKFNKTLAQAGQDSDLEYMAYVTYLAAKRQRVVEGSVAFDDWASTVMAIEPHEDEEDGDGAGESPAPPAE